jgi:hypothetical protein
MHLIPFRALPDDAQEHHDTTDTTIAESNNFIVLDKFTEWESGDRYQSESELERELIQDLRNQGYEFVPDLTSQQAMLANVRSASKPESGGVF